MKKVLFAIIAVFYLGTSMGATVNLHYCMGRLVDWDLSHERDHTCGKCGMDKTKKNGCCEDKFKVVQVEKDQKAESAYKLSQPPAIAIIHHYPSFNQVIVPVVSEEQPVSHAPPRTQVPVHIRYCVFRI
jgi:hypothetical protein